MASVTIFLLLATVFCYAASFSVLDYQDGEIPGIASPFGELEDLVDFEEEELEAPKPCTFPAQWQGNLSISTRFSGRRPRDGDDNRHREEVSTVFVDSTNKRVAGKAGFGNRTRGSIVLFGANNTADLYVFLVNQKKCFHKKLEHAIWRPQQIPPNATYITNIDIGPQNGGLNVQLWVFSGHSMDKRHGRKAFIRGSITVTPSQCIPVLFATHGRISGGPKDDDIIQDEDDCNLMEKNEDPEKRRRCRGISFSSGGLFFGIQPSISDPNVFTPPTYCKSTTLFYEGEEDMMPDFVEKFVDYY